MLEIVHGLYGASWGLCRDYKMVSEQYTNNGESNGKEIGNEMVTGFGDYVMLGPEELPL